MSGDLVLADKFSMPREAITDTFAIFGNRGKGKSNTATVLVEQLYAAGLPVVVLDVKGDWWGLRSSADGKGKGLPFIIFGGDHGDVPLEPSAGELLADLIVDERIHAVLDMSHMSKTQARSFTVAFAERLYRRNRDALHLIVEEADVLVPQRVTAETARLLGAMEDIAKRGRSKGIGLTLISQRPQEVGKSVLDLMETLILMGMTGPRSINAIKEWIAVNADDAGTAEVIRSLPTLGVGEAWIWSPSFLGVLVRVLIRKASTFDSHATPKPGEVRQIPKGYADVDLLALGERIAATVEKAKADDPRALRARITELERLLAAKVVPVEPQRVEVPAVSEQMLADLQVAGLRIADVMTEAMRNAVEPLMTALATLHAVSVDTARIAKPLPARPGDAPVAIAARPLAAPRAAIASRPTAPNPPSGEARPGGLPKAQRAVLTALAQYHPRTRTRNQVALLAQYSGRSGGFSNTLGALRTAGYIIGSGDLKITDAGLEALGDYEPLPSGADLRTWWCNNTTMLGKAHRVILATLIDVYPDGLDRDKLGEVTGYSAASGGFSNALGKLRSLELITREYPVRASSDLFD